MIYKSILLILGYLYGTMLTATFVVKHSTGNDVSKIGSGNPGMANVMEHIGKKEGVLVLAGDILKVIVAGILGRLLFPDKTWHDIFLYTGFGAIFGHNYPLWRKGKGGKGDCPVHPSALQRGLCEQGPRSGRGWHPPEAGQRAGQARQCGAVSGRAGLIFP